jgi:RimJ/RimL family protein N-acetyltransferase
MNINTSGERHTAAVTNEFQQPVGAALPAWTPRARPPRTPLTGRFCRIEPVDVERHAAELHEAYSEAPDGGDWTYMGGGPFADLAAYRAYLTQAAAGQDPLHYAIIDLATGKAAGTFSLMRIDPANGVIEVGNVAYSRRLRRTPVATEAMYLLTTRVFDELGYRRYEWKCDHLNAPSRAAALRYGFQYEGIFRQAVIYKGRTRDTAWFAMIDAEWPRIRRGYEQWLAAENFDAAGAQRQTLATLIARQRG